jgi:hypothetical protein
MQGVDAKNLKHSKHAQPILTLENTPLHTSKSSDHRYRPHDRICVGASFSLLVGQLGMRMAIQANVRAASASRRGFNEALSIAYYAGTITGMLTDGLGLFGGTLIFMIFGRAAPDALLGFGFGGTLLALFMRVGGGIYTKAADVGADLVGKVEQDIPEDDPRNAAVIADLVGDNVGDCAGMAADIFSYETTSSQRSGPGIGRNYRESMDRPNSSLRHRCYQLDLGHLYRSIWENSPQIPALRCGKPCSLL